MKNCQITTRLSVIAVIASSLLVVGIVTALSMIEQADASLDEDYRNKGQCIKANGPEFVDDCSSFSPRQGPK